MGGVGGRAARQRGCTDAIEGSGLWGNERVAAGGVSGAGGAHTEVGGAVESRVCVESRLRRERWDIGPGITEVSPSAVTSNLRVCSPSARSPWRLLFLRLLATPWRREGMETRGTVSMVGGGGRVER